MANTLKANGKKFLCKYRVDALVIMLGAENIKLDPSNILSIEYLNDYEYNIRSILKVSLRVDVRRKIWILKNKRSLSAKFELVKIGMDIDTEDFVTTPRTVWNNEFGVYLNDEEEASDTKMMEERINKNEGHQFSGTDISTENYFESQNLIDIYLFDMKLMNASTKTVNAIYSKDLLQQMVARILKETGHKRVLMSPFENDEVYEELIVPALPAYKALSYLDQYYGMYKTGAMIFYDVNTLYILNSNGKVTAKQEKEGTKTVIMVLATDDGVPGSGMIKVGNDVSTYVAVTEMEVNPQKPSTAKNETYGSEAKIVVSDDITVSLTEADQSYINQRNENIAYTRKDDNKFIATITKARMEENDTILYISANNIDMNAFTPNKEFYIIFDETSKHDKYSNYVYRLTYAYHMIKATSDQYMDSSHQLVFKKAACNSESL